MTRKIYQLSVLFFLFICLGGIIGCQSDINLGLGGKFFYPDQVGEKKMGDPRKPMYEGSGYTERETRGGEVAPVGFRGMKGGE